ncbi:antitoxin VbhA family protein [Kribbella sp. WER1]
MAENLDIEQRWPELFAPLDDDQRRSVVQSFANIWHEGWEPNRDDVQNLTDRARGLIDDAEYLRRAEAAADRRAGQD